MEVPGRKSPGLAGPVSVVMNVLPSAAHLQTLLAEIGVEVILEEIFDSVEKRGITVKNQGYTLYLRYMSII